MTGRKSWIQCRQRLSTAVTFLSFHKSPRHFQISSKVLLDCLKPCPLNVLISIFKVFLINDQKWDCWFSDQNHKLPRLPMSCSTAIVKRDAPCITPGNIAFPIQSLVYKPISGRVDRASATEAVDSGSIPGRVKPKTIKIGIHSFPAWRSALKRTVWSRRRVW